MAILSLPALLAAQLPVHGQTTASWLNPASGAWTTASNWSTDPFAPINGSPAGATYAAEIAATGAAYIVTLSSSVAVNSVHVGSPGAQLLVNNATLTTSTIDLSGGTLTLQGGTIKNATISGSGIVNNASGFGGTLDGVKLGAAMNVTDLFIRNGLTLTGGTITDTGSTTGGDMRISASQTFGGTGSIILDGDSIQLLQSGPQTVLTVDPGVTISSGAHGDGGFVTQYAFTGKVINKGTILASGPNAYFTFDTVTWTNQGIFRVLPNSTLVLGGVFSTSDIGVIDRQGGTVMFSGDQNNTGAVFQADASTGDYTLARSGTLTGGTLRTRDSAKFIIGDSVGAPNYTFKGVTVDGQVTGNEVEIVNGLTMTPGSSINIAIFNGTQTASGSGTFGSAIVSGGTATLSSGITVNGGLAGNFDSNVPASLVNHGTISNVFQVGFNNPSGHFTSDGTILLHGGSCAFAGIWTNQAGTLVADQGAKLFLGGSFSWSALGAHVDLNNATIVLTGTLLNSGSTVSLTAPNQLVLGSQSLVDGGTLGVVGGEVLVQRSKSYTGEPQPGLRNVSVNGTLRTAANNFGTPAVMLLDDVNFLPGSVGTFTSGLNLNNALLHGSGNIYLSSPDGNVPVLVIGGGVGTIESGITIHAVGNQRAQFFGPFVNRGLITNDNASAHITMAGAWTNAGTLHIGGATLELGGTISTGSIGTIDRVGTGLVKLSANLDNSGTILDMSSGGANWTVSGATITGGTITSSVAGFVPFSGTLNSVAIAAPLLGGAMTFNQATFNNTTISASTLRVLDTNVINSSGTLMVSSSITGTPSTALTLGPNLTTIPAGGVTLNGTATNQGTIITGAGPSDVIFNGKNQGWIHVTNGALRVGGASFSNTGTISLESNGTLNLDAPLAPWNLNGVVRNAGNNIVNITGPLDNTGQARDLATTPLGQVCIGNNGSITGGTLTNSNGAPVTVNKSAATFDGVTIAGVDLAIENTASLTVRNGLSFTGTRAMNVIRYDGMAAVGTGTLFINSADGNFVRTDSGTLFIGQGMNVRNLLSGSTAFTITLGSGSTALNNSGTVTALNNLTTFNVLGSSITNAGTFAAINRGYLNFPDPSGLTNLAGQTLTGGSWIVSNGGSIGLGTASIVTSNAFVQLDGATASFAAINSLASNGGTLLLTTGRNFSSAGDFTNSGRVTLGIGSNSLKINGALSNNGTIDITSNGSTIFSTGNNFVRVNGAFTNSGTINLNAGMIIDYSAESPLDQIRTQVSSGFAGGAWTGSGINSVSASFVGGTTSNRHKTAIGYAEASAVGKTKFANENLDSTCVLLAYTWSGDANLSGNVNAADFFVVASNFNQSGTIWSQGDFNYDGTVNALDFSLLASNFGQSGILAPPLASVGVLLPEPILAGFIACASLLFRRKARLKQTQPAHFLSV